MLQPNVFDCAMWRRLLIVSALYGCFLNVQVFPNCVQWYSSMCASKEI